MANRDLTTGAVRGHLARLGLPMVFGIVGVLSISLADAYFLGQIGTTELAAISYTFPVVLTLQSLGIGLSAGASSVASRAIGAGETQEARRLATDAIILAVLMIAVLAVAGLVVVRPLFAALGADGEVLDAVVRYMRVWFFGLPFLVVPMVANGLIRANGDSVAPSAIMVFAAVINVGLDPLFIFGWGPIPALDVEGAAWASLIARAMTFFAALGVLIFREKLLTAAIPALGDLAASWRRVLAVGAPAAVSTSVNPLAITAVTGFLAGFGDETVAAFGVATRIESLACVPMLALSSAIGPVAGQNWGNGAPERTLTAMWSSFWFSCGWAIVIAGVFWFAAPLVAGRFTDDPGVARQVALYLRITALSLAGYGVVVTASAAFNATGRALQGLGMTSLRSGVLYMPLAGAGVLLGQPVLAFVGIAAANVLSGGLVWVWAIRRTSGSAQVA